MDNYIINKICPVCHNDKVELSELGTEICTQCRYVIPGPTDATNSISNTNKYCPECKTPLEGSMSSGWWECPNCHYGYMDYIGDPLQDNIQMSEEDIEVSKHIFEGKLHVPCDNTWGVGKTAITDQLAQNTLIIEKCEKIKMHHKEMDIDFEFDTKKIENIDTIIINGHKFVRENNETNNT